MSRRETKKLNASKAEATTAQELQIKELRDQLKQAQTMIHEMAESNRGASTNWSWHEWSWWESEEPAAKWAKGEQWSSEADWSDTAWGQTDCGQPGTEAVEGESGIALNHPEAAEETAQSKTDASALTDPWTKETCLAMLKKSL